MWLALLRAASNRTEEPSHVRGVFMTCHRCTSPETLREKARISALEQQNTDLIAIVKELAASRVSIDVRFSPDLVAIAKHPEDMQALIARDAAKRAAILIENMLEDRRQFFYDYNLLKHHATPSHYQAVNEALFK
jgi:hypothetical protein